MSHPTPATFAELNLSPNIEKALTLCGYTQPTPVQAESIPAILTGKDVVVSAQTGTGKTAAFVLPSLQHLSKLNDAKQNHKPRILILTPTRELATQVTKAAGLYGKFLKFNIISLVGGVSYQPQIRDLARGADVIVATPGRLLDHLEQKRVDLSKIDILILDEADRMLDMGFIEDVEYIAKLTPKQRQTLLFSATVNSQLMGVVKHLLNQPTRIDLSDKKISAPLIQQSMYKTANATIKTHLLTELLQEGQIYKAIIFSSTKLNADKLAATLRDQGFAASALHGDLRQNVRNRTLDQFRRGKVQFLVATDVAARGIDVSDITHVINYDLPRFCEDYVHRIGRTGRAGKTGHAISFVSPMDAKLLQRIERFTGQRIKLITHTTTASHATHASHDRHEKHDSMLERPKPKTRKKTSFSPAAGSRRRSEETHKKQGEDFSQRKNKKPRNAWHAAPKDASKRHKNEKTESTTTTKPSSVKPRGKQQRQTKSQDTSFLPFKKRPTSRKSTAVKKKNYSSR